MTEKIKTIRRLQQHLVIWILVPRINTSDANLEYYYDFRQSYLEYKKVFTQLAVEWKWRAVSMDNYETVISEIIPQSVGKIPVVLNLCDGDETHGIPGLSVIRQLETKGIIYSGADEYFYDITTSKIVMKQLFDLHGVPTPGWRVINNPVQQDIFHQLPAPLMIKPAVSAGSMGVDIRSVVNDFTALQERLLFLEKGYRGWKLAETGIIAETFINGPEYTSLIFGDSRYPQQCFVYPPVESVFHPALPDQEKILSFDRLWEMYDYEKPLAGNEDFFSYHAPDPLIAGEINRVSLQAYTAVKGKGYGRIDLRMDKLTGKLYVLEVNAQCGLSEDEDYTSVGAILRLSCRTFTDMITDVILDALNRSKKAVLHKAINIPG